MFAFLGPWADYLYFKATTLVASSVVRERTDLQGQATTSRLPSLPLTFFSKRKSNTIKVLLFPGFDSLDVAGILEACFGLASTHIVELVAMQGVPPANADELVVTGGDSSARNANQSKIVRVRCDSAIHAPIDALPKDWTSSVILVPSVPPEKYVQLEASLASGLEDLLRGSAAVLACGEAMVRLLQSRNTLSEQVLNEYNGPKRWGQDETGKLFVAQTGVTREYLP
ncbi:uncharacterized protein EV422DRAFT_424884 [Fimicolochytrium jonesii]|uniref:uncharacterized protein n=1 Tax=Fimicolochytrium jonesii TaxID=1396493 RepID=UPI0022FE6735|nr:uncharacterized protein EV422DRAFT_424884 [Fimicolochytrium jonesii]KAI8821640.1 hypothetical protein EV422DRAFT_424884 [Fimicolochytrium jonesii]